MSPERIVFLALREIIDRASPQLPELVEAKANQEVARGGRLVAEIEIHPHPQIQINVVSVDGEPRRLFTIRPNPATLN